MQEILDIKEIAPSSSGERTCAICLNKFTPIKINQKFCGLRCRKKNERLACKQRDPRGAERDKNLGDTRRFSFDIHNPSVEQLNAVQDNFASIEKLGQQVKDPARFSGRLPEGWQERADRVLTRSEAENFWLLF